MNDIISNFGKKLGKEKKSVWKEKGKYLEGKIEKEKKGKKRKEHSRKIKSPQFDKFNKIA